MTLIEEYDRRWVQRQNYFSEFIDIHRTIVLEMPLWPKWSLLATVERWILTWSPEAQEVLTL